MKRVIVRARSIYDSIGELIVYDVMLLNKSYIGESYYSWLGTSTDENDALRFKGYVEERLDPNGGLFGDDAYDVIRESRRLLKNKRYETFTRVTGRV